MAKGKGGSGTSSTSKGERRSSAKTAGPKNTGERILAKMDALNKGKDVVFTIENPNKAETNKKFIRVRVSGKKWVDDRKKNGYRIKGDVAE